MHDTHEQDSLLGTSTFAFTSVSGYSECFSVGDGIYKIEQNLEVCCPLETERKQKSVALTQQ